MNPPQNQNIFLCGKVEGGTVQDELSKRAMVWSTKKSIARKVMGHRIDEYWQYPVPDVSGSPAPGQKMHQVLSWGWVVGVS
jgi:hypothetical protein